MRVLFLLLVVLSFALNVADGEAQTLPQPPPLPPPVYGGGLIVEGGAGVASFVDEVSADYAYLVASCRGYHRNRLAVGPEFVYMSGPDHASQWHLTATATIDLVLDEWTRRKWRRVIPYLVVAGGYQRATSKVGSEVLTSSEGSLSGGIGARVALTERVFLAPEFRLGWESHFRIGVTVGWRMARITKIF